MTNASKGKRPTLLELALPCRDARVLFAWPAACLLLGCVLWGVTLGGLRDESEQAREQAYRQSLLLAQSYAEQVARTVEQMDQMALNLKHYWEASHGTLGLGKQVAGERYPASSHLHVAIVDRSGAILGSTADPPVRTAMREQLRAQGGGDPDGLRIGRPEQVAGGKTFIPFSRPLQAADGSFAGAVIVSVEPDYLASFPGGFGMDRHGFLSLITAGGAVLATRTGEGGHASRLPFRSLPAFEAASGAVRMDKDMFADARSRIVAWQRLENYPLIAAVALSEQEAFTMHELMARERRRMAVTVSIFLLLLAAAGMVFSSRLAWRKKQADEVKDTYRLATDGAREGFYMARAVYDRDHNIVDFLVEDCNERGAALFGVSRERIVGAGFSELIPAGHMEYVLDIFRRAMATGFFEEEFKVLPGSPLKGAWMYRRLVRSGSSVAMTLRDISDVKAHEQALADMVNTDVLTSLPNRHWLMKYLPKAVEQARARNSLLAVLFVDLDDFKNINDTVGHEAGDELLQGAAMRLKAVVRPSDNVVRLGGDEFTIILEHVDSADDVARLADRIVKALGAHFVLAGGGGHFVRASIGISLFPRDGDDGDTLLRHADIAMYAAKANRKGSFAFYEPRLSERLVARNSREQALRKAIAHDEMVVYYQPRVATFSGELRSMEALVRWMHPELGLVPPQAFIPLAEETGLITELGELVIRKVFAQMARWKRQGLPLVPVSINVSARQFNQGNLAGLFASGVAQYGIDSSLVEIEITESCMIGDDRAVAAELAALDALGLRLLVDDFGTGYSSLSQLQRLELHGLKVDRAFTSALGEAREGQVFFKAILSMAHALGMTVVAEGVESMAQLRVLQELSCDEVQGHYISPALPASQMRAVLRKRFLFPPYGDFLHRMQEAGRGQQLFLGL